MWRAHARCSGAHGRWTKTFVAGLAFAAALNVKLIPLAVLPAVALLLPNLRTMVRFGAGLAVGLIPFLPPVMFVGGAFYRNTVAYQPRTLWWGIHFVLSWGFALPGIGSWLQFVDGEYGTHARYVHHGSQPRARSVGAVVEAVGHRGGSARRRDVSVLTPGIGIQYMVMLVPVLVMTDSPQSRDLGSRGRHLWQLVVPVLS
jgi:hypothetical protein